MSKQPRLDGEFDDAQAETSRERDVADLARGADGLTEGYDAETVARGLLEAQLAAASAMFTASMAVTTGSFKAMAAFWGADQTGRDDKDKS
ncbi:hypothetical protein [Pacificoceanicola onchidii]|uniref:hypothetical protein n=1 Tax=Pacificoceanicola onchidii TaxID=2562685 RepID=UPI0010A68354|nr:hypothetical protein [Pacificoceanicola onchidii]